MKTIATKNKMHLLGILACIALVFAFALPTSAGSVHYLRPYQTENATVYDGNPEEYFTMMGVKYYHGITSDDKYYDRHVAFNLEKGVDSVTFKLGHLDDTNTDNAEMKIYLDGVWYKTIELTSSMTTQTVTIPTTGKQQLNIDIIGHYGRYGMADIVYTGSKHNYEMEVTKVATVKADGSLKYTCRDCGKSYTKADPKKTYCDNMLLPYQSEYMTVLKELTGSINYISVMGKTYYKAIVIDDKYYNRTADYNLGLAYSQLAFTVGHMDNLNNTYGGTLYVKVDDTVVKTIECTPYMMNQRYTLDISGATKLSFEFEGHYGRYAIVDMAATPLVATKPAHSYQDEVMVEAQFGVTGITKHVCTKCGAYYTTASAALTRKLTDSDVSYSLSRTSFTYTGKSRKPSVTVKYGDTVLRKNTDYTLVYSNCKNAGTAKVVIKGKGFYKGSITCRYKINKAKQKLTTKKSSYRVKRGAKAFSLRARAGAGVITYKTNNPKVATVNRKGKVTIKRRKGTCIITVTAKATKNYRAATKKIKITVK